jgi:hypothetical protein
MTAQVPQKYLQVEAGIYRYKDKEGKITYTNGLTSMGPDYC